MVYEYWANNAGAGPVNNWWYMNFGNSHCCACAGVCYHVGGPYYCGRHSQPPIWTYTPQPSMSPEDVDRVARRLKELLTEE